MTAEDTELAPLACIRGTEEGETNRLIAAAAAHLLARGVAVIGGVQANTPRADRCKCDMDLKVLPDGPVIRISQDLGNDARGCRLDYAALEQAVALSEAELGAGTRMLIVNKFGKREAEGGGFRPLIASALDRGLPVLVGLGDKNAEAFTAFAGDFAETIAPTEAALIAWCDRVLA